MAQELLRHRFFKVARKTTTLTELIERYQRWRAEGGEEEEINNDTTEYVCVCVNGHEVCLHVHEWTWHIFVCA